MAAGAELLHAVITLNRRAPYSPQTRRKPRRSTLAHQMAQSVHHLIRADRVSHRFRQYSRRF